MSYAYLFKYIIIGDTGKPDQNRPKDDVLTLNHRCWQILPSAAVHRQEVQTTT